MAKVFGDSSAQHKRKYSVPSYGMAYKCLFSGEFLTLRDDEGKGAYDQLSSENTNLALICALLLTTFLPLYYTETSKLSIPDEGLTIDIFSGYFYSSVVHMNKSTLHDFFDTTYVLATGGMFFGTLCCVYFILMGNEAGTDERVLVFRRRLGIIARFPYYCFTIGAVSWGVSILCHIFITPFTLTGFVVKVTLMMLIIASFAVWVLPFSVQALYSCFHEEQEHPPLPYTEAEVRDGINKYFEETDAMEYCLKDCLHSLRKGRSPSGYLPPLS